MSAIARKPETVTVSPASASVDWQVDRNKRIAKHVSGLIVSWQTVGRGDALQPALDIAGLEKVTATQWAQKVNVLVEQAIALLESR